MSDNLMIDIPEKFKDENGNLNTDSLLKSYLALEKKMSGSIQKPSENATDEEKNAFFNAIGRPQTPEEYKINITTSLLGIDPEVNKELHTLGFTNAQVQKVYELAEHKILPVIEDLAADYEAERQKAHLISHFGSEEKWNEVSSQILAWAEQNVAEPLLDALSTTYDGIMALYAMMQKSEPSVLSQTSGNDSPLDEEGLKKLMLDPKYWKEQNPELLKKVADGFARLYPSRR